MSSVCEPAHTEVGSPLINAPRSLALGVEAVDLDAFTAGTDHDHAGDTIALTYAFNLRSHPGVFRMTMPLGVRLQPSSGKPRSSQRYTRCNNAGSIRKKWFHWEMGGGS